MRPGGDVLAGEIRRVEGDVCVGGKMTVAGSAGNTKKSGLGSIKEGLWVLPNARMEATCEKKKKRDPALS